MDYDTFCKKLMPNGTRHYMDNSILKNLYNHVGGANLTEEQVDFGKQFYSAGRLTCIIEKAKTPKALFKIFAP